MRGAKNIRLDSEAANNFSVTDKLINHATYSIDLAFPDIYYSLHKEQKLYVWGQGLMYVLHEELMYVGKCGWNSI